MTWQISRTTGPTELDVSVFLLGPGDCVRSDADFVFYNQPGTPDDTVRLVGDEHSETVSTPQAIEIELDDLPSDVDCVVVAVSVDSGTLAGVTDLVLSSAGVVPIRIEVQACPSSALVFAEITREDHGWSIRRRHQPHKGASPGWRGP